jgi:hypothetical protein
MGADLPDRSTICMSFRAEYAYRYVVCAVCLLRVFSMVILNPSMLQFLYVLVVYFSGPIIGSLFGLRVCRQNICCPSVLPGGTNSNG